MLFISIGIIGIILPALIGFIKFGCLPCYHTWASKISAVLISISLLLMFAFSITWLFRCAVIFQILVALDNIAITILIPTWRCNVPSVWHVYNNKY